MVILLRGKIAVSIMPKAESFEGWRAIGAALAVGKALALRVTGANAAWGEKLQPRIFRLD
jgi:hypothetical protein